MQQQPMQPQMPQQPYGYGGWTYNPPFMGAPTKLTNWLSQDKLDSMQKNLKQFSLAVTENELHEAQCNHINTSTNSTALIDIVDNGEHKFQCTLCGTIFPGREYTDEEVQNHYDAVMDILNIDKIAFHSLDPNAAMGYFQILAFLKKGPMLHKLAMSDNDRFEKSMGIMPQYPRMQTPIMFNMLGGGFGMMPQYAGYPSMQPPMPQAYPSQPMYPQQPQPMQPPQQPCGPIGNPLYGGQPQMYGFNPWAPQQPPQQQQPATPQQPQASAPSGQPTDPSVSQVFKK